MQGTKVVCPRCGKALLLAKPVPAGRRLGCPHCGTSFAPGGEAPAAPAGDSWWAPQAPSAPVAVAVPASVATRPAPPVAVAAAPPRPPHIAAAPPPVPIASVPGAAPAAAAGTSKGVLIGLGVIGFLLVAGTGTAVVLAMKEKKKDKEPAVADTGAPPDGARAPAAPWSGGPRVGGIPLPPQGNDRFDPPQIEEPIKNDGPKPPPVEEKPRLPPEKQEKVNQAIDRGITYLKRTQNPAGTWGGGQHGPALAALPGLTLLECGVPPDDPAVQQAARFVRDAVPGMNATYNLSACLLFLDRLGDPKDRAHIETLALRLLAGQTPGGGWSYTCPVLSKDVEKNFRLVLDGTRPRTARDLLLPGVDGRDLLGLVITGDGPGGNLQPPVGLPERPDPRVGPGPLEDRRPDPKDVERALAALPGNLRDRPAVQPPEKARNLPRGDASDNSNTQFAILALWAAGRHGVPMERAVAQISRRFRTMQCANGCWKYQYTTEMGAWGTPAMTGAGLLGLAVGHGLTAGDAAKGPEKKNGQDPMIQKGLKHLSTFVGGDLRTQGHHGQLYFLWTLERVGVLYGLETIGDKDWYAWAADVVLAMQKADGHFAANDNGGGPMVETSFALLVLKRANLAKDLSRKLEFVIEAKDPGGR